MALQTSPESPAPVRQIAMAIAGWVDRLGAVWVEGQVAQVSRRPGVGTVFVTLRDSVADLSIAVTAPRALVDGLSTPLVDGASVVIHAKPTFYPNRGSLSLQAREIRLVGLGELLARLERRRQLLAAEGLFAPERKRPVPFLPTVVGLVTAPGSAAERDVVENARRRWPAVRFDVVHAAMQGTRAAAEVMAALERLDRRPEVEVVVVARGGGSVEDLLPFSDEGLVRAVHRCRTPVVSAIGHEPDVPLLDLVADLRASTPTDAAKLVVPDIADERRHIVAARDRARAVVRAILAREVDSLSSLRSRPVLAQPQVLVDVRSADVSELRARARRTLGHGLTRGHDEVAGLAARVRSLSPLATLARGYAVLQHTDGSVVSSVVGVTPGTMVSARVSDGRIHASVSRTELTRTRQPREDGDHG